VFVLGFWVKLCKCHIKLYNLSAGLPDCLQILYKTSYNSYLQDLRRKKASEKDCDGIIKDAAFPEKGVRGKK